MNFSHIIQSLPTFLIDNRGMIYLLSAVVSLLFALAILSLVHRFKILQDDKWVKPFALAFLALTIMYAIRFAFWILDDYNKIELSIYTTYALKAGIAICSSLSNFFFIGVGFPLARKSRRLRDNILNILHIDPRWATFIFLLLLFTVTLITTMDNWWARIPDVFLSTLALGFVGVALYRNISIRRDPFMAWIAVLTAIAYALLHVVYGFVPWVAQAGWVDWLAGGQETLENKISKIDLIIFSIALPLKFGLFFPGYALMLMIASPIGDIKRLLEGVTHGTEEFLENEGVVLSIQEEIHASKVEVYIKLPGTKKNKVAVYRSPSLVPGAKSPEEIPFKKETPYGYVMNTGDNFLYRLINYTDHVPPGLKHQFSPRSSVIGVPIIFHNAVIGCLIAELDDGKLTEADMQNVQRFAAMLSPAVQDYREVDALNEISHRLTRLQIEASGYDIQEAANSIALITHDILAPLATGVSIEAGFHPYQAMIAVEAGCKERMEQQLKAPYTEIISTSDSANLSWWPKKLQVTSNELGDNDNQHFFGKLVLASHHKWNRAYPPTLATNFFHRRVVSNLITEAFLNFIRGYLNDVAKELGVRLSGSSELDIPYWFEAIDKISRKAKLLWTVASQRDDPKLLGEKKDLVQELERIGQWKKKNTYDDPENKLDLWLCSLESPEDGTSHVIKISSRETNQIIWMGVGNPAFSLEMDYLSPWKAFIIRFGVIADLALQRILNKEERENLEKEAAEFHGLATTAITTGTVVHQMVNQVRDLASPLTTLENAIRFRSLQGNENHRKLILSLGKAASQIEELTKLFSGVTKPDDRRPCSLREAIQYASNLLRDSFVRYGINFNPRLSSDYIVDVPSYVAGFALANLLNNAKDAIRDAKVKDGEIKITIEENENLILCHVIDNGPGVPPHLIGQLFKSGGKGNKQHSSGLGLYLSVRSLREARGDLVLTNPGPVPPTTFTISFPKQRKV